LTPDRPPRKRRLKLWHFAVVVLLAALIFGTIRALSQRGPDGPAEAILVSMVIASACGGAAYAIIRLGRKVAGRATSGLKEWGIRRDGLVGFLAYLIAFMLEVGFFLVAIVLGPVLVITLIALLTGMTGR
jgi:hypothetical protein